MLSWDRVAGAEDYDVQVATDPGFASVLDTVTTANRRFVPPRTLPPESRIWWRVRASDGPTTSAWATATFDTALIGGPTLLAPAHEAVLAQPAQPLLLSWSPVPGATGYALEVDDAQGFPSPVTAADLKTTSYVIRNPGAPTADTDNGTWWRVRANFGDGLRSEWSEERMYQVRGLPAPSLTRPAYTAGSPLTEVTDIQLEWNPVPGAVRYRVQVSIDEQFSHVRADDGNVIGTTYSPMLGDDQTRPWFNDQYFWRVRAIDANSDESDWSDTWRFERSWEDQPVLQYPAADSTVGDPFFFQWTAVPHATSYQVHWQGVDGTTGSGSCPPTVLTTQAGCGPNTAGTYMWRVVFSDNSGTNASSPYPGGAINGVQFLAGNEFTYAPGLSETETPAEAPVTGMRVAMTGTASQTPGQYCEVGPRERCDDVRSTPVLRWAPVAGATGYRLWVSHDANMTNGYFSSQRLAQPMFTFHGQGGVVGGWQTVPENQAEDGFYWAVAACFETCPGAVDITQHRVFNKRSNFVELVSPADQATLRTDVIRFEWTSYVETNTSISDLQETRDSAGQFPQQEARAYRFQVSRVPNFQSLVVNHVVDELEYSVPHRLLPEGQLYWRVIPVEQGVPSMSDNNAGASRNLSTSGAYSTLKDLPDVRTFVKATLAPEVIPVNGGSPMTETSPLTWEPRPFAASYNVEVYRNNDSGGSDGLQPQAANRVVALSTAQTAVVLPSPLPASDQRYRWRVQKVDASGNVGPWSRLNTADAAMHVAGSAPTPQAPADGVTMTSNDAYFAWSAAEAASRYRIEVEGDNGTLEVRTTPALGWAPSTLAPGSYRWRVTALDPVGNDGASGPWRQFRVVGADTTPPAVDSFRPADGARIARGARFVVIFTEPVRGVTRTSMRLLLRNRMKVAARITMRDARTAVLDPSRKLRARARYTLRLSTGITDVNGNRLRATSVTVATKAR